MRVRYQIHLYSALLGFLWLLPQSVSGQRQKSRLVLQTDSLIHELRSAGVDTFCVYKGYCVGCRGSNIADNSPCATKGLLIPTYLFWKKSGHSYRRYFDNCTLGATQEMKDVFWGYFDRFHSEMRTEDIKEFHVLDEGKPTQVFRNHGGSTSFRVITPRDTIDQYFDDFSLTKYTNLSRKKERNIYYQQNRKTRVYKFFTLLAKATVVETKY